MNVFLLLTIVVLASVGQIAETRPKQHSGRANKVLDNQAEKIKCVGCVFPYQYVNPYYHPRTARSCSNLFLGLAHTPMPDSNDYQIGCDCIPGFASNYQGYCIDETQCNLWEAFGTLIDEGAVHSSDNSAAEEQNTQSIDALNEIQPPNQQSSQQFFRANETVEQHNDGEDEDDCCDEENDCCECDDEATTEKSDENNTEKAASV